MRIGCESHLYTYGAKVMHACLVKSGGIWDGMLLGDIYCFESDSDDLKGAALSNTWINRTQAGHFPLEILPIINCYFPARASFANLHRHLFREAQCIFPIINGWLLKVFGNSVRLGFYQLRAPLEVAYDQRILGRQPRATNKRMSEKKEKHI